MKLFWQNQDVLVKANTVETTFLIGKLSTISIFFSYKMGFFVLITYNVNSCIYPNPR